ncbi:MAG: DNA polymerase III subunit alpha [candidate division KSB1 bacterium]|nr:DNA polymerase III subunit alpha [candidate division KSB1 bacterium]
MLRFPREIPFVHLHLHSNYSFCRGANSLEDLCTALKAQGASTFALTDLDGLYGVVWAQQAAELAGLRMIVGAELRAGRTRAVLLVKETAGYANLCQLISEKHAQERPDDGWLVRALRRRREGLVVLSDSPALLQALRRDGADDLYLLCIPGPHRRRLLRLARQLHLPPVASNDVYFVSPDDYPVHRVLRAIDNHVALSRIPAEELAPHSAWLKTPADMWAAFPDAPEALENTVRIAEACTFRLPRPGNIFPRFPVPEGKSELQCLRELCLDGIRRRYGIDLRRPGGGELAQKLRARLDKELTIISMKGFASYFLVMWDIVQHASRTCGRGSAAASLVSYALGITHVDPIRHDLFFERFLHMGREDPPDIDVDFAWDERDGMLEYIFETYGREHTAMIANHVTFKGRAALREIARAYGLPEAEINRVSKRLSGYSIRSIAETIRTHPMFRGVELHEPWPEIIRLADRINGFPRNLSVHCGGVVITPEPVSRYVPVQKAPKGVMIVQVEKDQAEELGLIKLDILGNRSLGVIRDAVAAVKRNTGIEIDFNRIDPTQDEKTQELIRHGDTIGVFYVESPAMRLLQKKARTGDFEHLVIHSSIIRPAANAYIREYVRRLHGGEYEPLHPLLDDLLKETYGILSYQEDISRVAMALADFDAAEADGLRKAFSRKNNEHILQRYREKFFAGARRKGVAEEAIRKIWEMILSFSGYSFCKPHSASYALVSYQAAYLRAHFPAEFMAAVISNQGGFYSTFAYISEAKRMGLRVLPVDINRSEREYTGRGRDLRIGFMQLRGFEEAAIETILEERRANGPFGSFEEFVRRTDLSPAMLEILIKAGAFDSLVGMEARPFLLWELEQQRLQNLRAPSSRHSRQTALFDAESGSAPDVPAAPPRLRPFDLRTLLRHEMDTLGFLVSRHPLTLYRPFLRGRRLVPAKDLHRHVGRRVQVLGWYVTGKLVRTKNDDPMEFMSFEDTTAIYETTFFPQAYETYCHLFTHLTPYILTGKVEEDFGAITLTVERVEKVRLPGSPVAPPQRGRASAGPGPSPAATSRLEKLLMD